MRARELPGHYMPDSLAKITNRELEVAGNDLRNLETLKEKSLGFREVADGMWSLVLSKFHPYVPGAGFDNMLFVAKEGSRVENIAQLAPEQLTRLLEMAEDLQNVYRREAETEDKVALEVIAVNFHEDPIPKDVFARKLHVQTLQDLHVHVTSFRERDLVEAQPLARSSVSKQEWRDIHDPFLQVVEKLWQNRRMRMKLMHGLTTLTSRDKVSLPGINFRVRTDQMSTEPVAHDLITLHENFVECYQMISGLFVESGSRDATGMPRVRPMDERVRRVEHFLSGMEQEANSADTRFLSRWFGRMNNLLISGEDAQQTKTDLESQNIFLRGPAYTLSMLHTRGDSFTTINLSPRILSTGNMLSSLGLHKSMRSPVTAEWLEERERVEQAIRGYFSDKASQAAA